MPKDCEKMKRIIIVCGIILVAFSLVLSIVGCTCGVPISVTTVPADLVTQSSARLNGDLHGIGAVAEIWVTFWWSQNEDDLDRFHPSCEDTGNEMVDYVGPFDYILNNLSPSTTYYYRAKALIVEGGEEDHIFGEILTFTTDPLEPLEVEDQEQEDQPEGEVTQPDEKEEGEDSETVIPIPIGGRNNYMALSPDKSRLYVVDQGPDEPDDEGKVWVINTATNIVENSIGGLGSGYAFQIKITPDGNWAYLAIAKAAGTTTRSGPNRIAVIDTSSNEVTQMITITGTSDYGPLTVAMHPDGTYVYTAHRGDNKVQAINIANNTVEATVSDVGSGPIGLAVSNNGSRLWVVSRTDSTMSVIDIDNEPMTLMQKSIPLGLDVGGGQTFISVTPDSTRAYVITSFDPRIAVIDINPDSLKYLQVEHIETTATSLAQIAISPDGTRALVASPDGVLVIDIEPTSDNYHKQIGTVSVGSATFGVVYADLPGAIAYVSKSGVWAITDLP